MSNSQPLHGSCNCGRNNYTILLPTDAPKLQEVQVFIDDSNDDRSAHPTPYLRIPLSWYHSSTTSFFPDETHTTIRRTFTPLHASHIKRIFCGICGTHLSYWSEEPVEEAGYLSIPVGSLRGEDARRLNDLGVLPDDDDDRAIVQSTDVAGERSVARGNSGGMSWIEELINRSRVGKTSTTRRGKGVSADGRTTVEWEISEYREGDTDTEPATTAARGKRKIGDIGAAEDVGMK